MTGSGNVQAEIKESIGVEILRALTDGKRYVAAENGESFLAEFNALLATALDGVVYDDKISEIGAKFGAGFVCAVEVTPTFDAFHILARMIDVRTAEAVSIGNAFGHLKSEADIAEVSVALVKKMADERIVPSPPPQQPSPSVSSVSQEPRSAPPPMVLTVPPALQSIVSTLLHGEEDKRMSMTGVSLGGGLSQDADSKTGFLQLGLVHVRPIYEKAVLLNFEGNLWLGMGKYAYKRYDGSAYGNAEGSMFFLGVNVPATVLFQWNMFSCEAGLFGDMLFADGEVFYNAGFAAGVGITIDKKRARRYYYRYNSGFKYNTHVVGMGWLF